MPGIAMDDEPTEDNRLVNGNSTPPPKESNGANKSPKTNEVEEEEAVAAIDTSIEQLYENVCDMQSSDQSPSRRSFGSDGEESRIDSELRHLVGGEMREVEIIEEEVMMGKQPSNESRSDSGSKKESPEERAEPPIQKKPSPKGKAKTTPQKKPPFDRRTSPGSGGKKKTRSSDSPAAEEENIPAGEPALDNPDLGPFLLKQARQLVSSGDHLNKALELAQRAAKSFEACSKKKDDGEPSLELVMCLHVTAAIHCNLGRYSEAVPILERSIEIPNVDGDGGEGRREEHALAKFAGQMQLGDTYAMLGMLEKSVASYESGLEIQRRALGDTDPRVGETFRYLAEAHVQAMRLDEAERLCKSALEIHRENGSPASLEEAADRRLMGLIYETKGDHEAALEHLVLAGMALSANSLDAEAASVDCSIGDAYSSLSRFDEAAFSYQKALTVFKSTKGETHPSVASVFVRLAELYNKTGKIRDSRSYCENALRIYERPVPPGFPAEEIAGGLTDVAAIFEGMDELRRALGLLERALGIYAGSAGQQSAVAGIEAQMGVMSYMLGDYDESYRRFASAVAKLRAGGGERRSAFFGVALNQMGLACVQRLAVDEAAKLFEEAREVLSRECGPYHPDTLGVYSNLAAAYDAIGRLDDAIELLEYVVGVREEKLGTANPDVDEEKRRLAELLKEAGRARTRKARSLETLLDTNGVKEEAGIKV